MIKHFLSKQGNYTNILTYLGETAMENTVLYKIGGRPLPRIGHARKNIGSGQLPSQIWGHPQGGLLTNSHSGGGPHAHCT